MRFFLDHDVPIDLAIVLRTQGHEATRLMEALPPNTPDDTVWRHACAKGLTMISCNRGHFLALALATASHPGLIILNRRRTRQAECAHVLRLIAKTGPQGLANNVNFA